MTTPRPPAPGSAHVGEGGAERRSRTLYEAWRHHGAICPVPLALVGDLVLAGEPVDEIHVLGEPGGTLCGRPVIDPPKSADQSGRLRHT